MNKETQGSILLSLFLLLLLIFLSVLAVTVGPAKISLEQVQQALFSHADSQVMTVVWEIRLPRIVLSFLVGSALAVSGTVFQGLLSNHLAGPFTLGISSGAAFGAIIAIFFGLAVWVLPFLALLGAGITLFIVFLLSWSKQDFLPQNMVLAGIVVGSILSAGISLMKSLSGESLTSIVFWIMGSLAGRGWVEVKIFLPYFLIGLTGVFIFIRDLDLLCMGADYAHSSGVDVANTRKMLVFFASLLAAGAVAVSGVIGFVGLVVPHLVRLFVGPAHRRLSLFCAATGGILLLAADTLARVLADQAEIPVGVITSLLGGPFFCFLLVRRNRNGERGL